MKDEKDGKDFWDRLDEAGGMKTPAQQAIEKRERLLKELDEVGEAWNSGKFGDMVK